MREHELAARHHGAREGRDYATRIVIIGHVMQDGRQDDRHGLGQVDERQQRRMTQDAVGLTQVTVHRQDRRIAGERCV